MPYQQPEKTNRKIILAVTGLSPQVVTETLYALSVTQHPPWIPDEIHLFTTRAGTQRARLALLSDDPGWFHRLLNDYNLPPIAFDDKYIHLLRDAAGNPLDDIRTIEENECAADQITELVRHFTADSGTELHVSIAGGRKTMGYYLGYALSLFGRDQDRLSHVLVSEPFESSWNFFYPTPDSHVIETRDGALADTKEARVVLAEIPFVRLRHGLDQRLLDGRAGFSEAVHAAMHSFAPPKLILDLGGQQIQAADRTVHLPPKELALFSLFARRRLNRKPPLEAPPKHALDEGWANRFLEEYRRVRSGELDDLDRVEKALKNGMDGDYFSSTKSKLHQMLRRSLGTASHQYLIDDGGGRPRRYCLRLPPEAIEYGKLAEQHNE